MPLNKILEKIVNCENGIVGAVLGDYEGEKIVTSCRADIIELDDLSAYVSVLLKQIYNSQEKMKIGSFSELTSLNEKYHIHIISFNQDLFLAIIFNKKLKPLKLEQTVSSYIEELRKEIE